MLQWEETLRTYFSTYRYGAKSLLIFKLLYQRYICNNAYLLSENYSNIMCIHDLALEILWKMEIN